MIHAYTVILSEGLDRRMREVCITYDVTPEQLLKLCLRNTMWYEKNYRHLPGNKSVLESGEDSPSPKNVVLRVIEAIKEPPEGGR